MHRAAVFLMLGSAHGFGAELAILANGMQMKVERHQREGNEVVLYSASGFTRMPADQVVAFEALIDPAAVVPAPAPAQPAQIAAGDDAPPKTPQQLLEEAAAKHNIPASFLKLVANAESGMNQKAVSPKGAIGIMQLMPDTAKALGANPHDPAQNVDAGTRYLRDLLIQYQGNDDQLRRALAAYNAGPGAVERYNGVPPYRETQNYVQKIVEQYKRTAQ